MVWLTYALFNIKLRLFPSLGLNQKGGGMINNSNSSPAPVLNQLNFRRMILDLKLFEKIPLGKWNG